MTEDAKKFAIIALSVFLLSEIVQASINYLTRGESYLYWVTVTSIATVIFWWFLPFLIVYKVEKKDAKSLGLTIRREKYHIYSILAIIGLILPAFIVGFDTYLITEFIEQIVYIGLAEEFFHRGYLMSRLCRWLGDWKGLFLSTFTFSLGHIISRLAEKGFGYIGPATQAAT